MFPTIGNWQDGVIAFGQVIFFASLLFTVFSKEKPSLWTSIPTGIVLIIYAYTFFTLKLWYGGGMSALVAVTWLVIGCQKIRRDKRQAGHKTGK